MKQWLCMVALLGCASGGSSNPGAADLALSAGESSDLSMSDLSAPVPDLGAAPDLAQQGPSELDCYYNWKTRSGCPAPQITESYLSKDCAGTTGVFVIGRYFQHGNQYDSKNGWMPHGPYATTPKLNRDTWNWITPRMVCITTAADPSYWSGFDMTLKNPDGQLSNTVTVQNRLAGRPSLPSTGSSEPFDPNACYDAGMTMAEALARFPAGATVATLGDVSIRRRSRQCNTLTGCAAFGAEAIEATAKARLQTAGSVHFALDDKDCGALGASEYTLSENSCAAAGMAGSYDVHVAGSCLMLWQTVRSTIAGDGSYTQTDYGAVLRY